MIMASLAMEICLKIMVSRKTIERCSGNERTTNRREIIRITVIMITGSHKPEREVVMPVHIFMIRVRISGIIRKIWEAQKTKFTT
jgi:hypothetical protein